MEQFTSLFYAIIETFTQASVRDKLFNKVILHKHRVNYEDLSKVIEHLRAGPAYQDITQERADFQYYWVFIIKHEKSDLTLELRFGYPSQCDHTILFSPL